MKTLFTLILIFSTANILGQRIIKNYQQILIASKLNKSITIDDSKKLGYHCVTTYLYLGNIIDDKGKCLKILTETSYYGGRSIHVSSKILFFNCTNSYIGEYNTASSPFELPTKLENGRLIFPHIEGCDNKQENVVNLRNGIPATIFFECSKGLGNIYGFSSSK